jgi:hypothetical protein
VADRSEQKLSRRRRITVWVLVVLATLIAFVGSLTVWVKRQLLDNNAWNHATEQVITDPQVQSALSVYLTNQLYANVDLEPALEQRLPENVKPLASPLAGLIRGRTPEAIAVVLQRPRIQSFVVNASTVAHQKLINVLENKTGYGISTGNGVVTLDLGGVLTQIGAEVGVPQAALEKIPPDAGQITIMKSDQLGAAQTAVQAIRVLSAWILVAVILLYAIAVYVARGMRRVVLRRIGWGILLVGVLVLLVRKLGSNYVVGAISKPENHEPVKRILLIQTQIMGQIGWAAVLYGVLVLVGVALAGSTRLARAIRSALVPAFTRHEAAVWSGAALVFLLLVLWGPTHALRTWWGILLIGALMAWGLYALKRQVLEEAAAGAHAPIAWPVPRPQDTVPATAASPAEEIARLRALLEQGSITSEEFERGKALALA